MKSEISYMLNLLINSKLLYANCICKDIWFHSRYRSKESHKMDQVQENLKQEILRTSVEGKTSADEVKSMHIKTKQIKLDQKLKVQKVCSFQNKINIAF